MADAMTDTPLGLHWTKRVKLAEYQRDQWRELSQSQTDTIQALAEEREALTAENAALRAEVDRHRERANAAQVAWLVHSDHDCAVKCCREIEAALGTESPVEAAKAIRELRLECERLRAERNRAGVEAKREYEPIIRELRAEVARQQAIIGALMPGDSGRWPSGIDPLEGE